MITLVYDRYESGEYYIHDVDNDVYYTVSGSFVPNSSAAVEWVRNYGINRRATIASGTHTKLTYDTYGIITSGTNATTADINDSIDRRYVTDAMLSNLQKAVTSITQNRVNTSYLAGDQNIGTVNLHAPEPSLAYTAKLWFKAAANQHDKKIYAKINGDNSYELFSITEKFDDEIIAITIEGICDNTTDTTQEWVTTILALNANANHSKVVHKSFTGCEVVDFDVFIDISANDDLTFLGYSSYYCKL